AHRQRPGVHRHDPEDEAGQRQGRLREEGDDLGIDDARRSGAGVRTRTAKRQAGPASRVSSGRKRPNPQPPTLQAIPMSKPVKNPIPASYKKRFGDLEGAVLVNVRGIKSNDNNKLRQDLAVQKVKVTVVKNSLAKRALEGTKLQQLCDMLEGPCAVVYG